MYLKIIHLNVNSEIQYLTTIITQIIIYSTYMYLSISIIYPSNLRDKILLFDKFIQPM